MTLRCGKRTAGSEQAPSNLERREPARREWNLTVRPSRSLGDSGATRMARDSSAAAAGEKHIQVGGGGDAFEDKSEREKEKPRSPRKEGGDVRHDRKTRRSAART